MSYKIKFIKSLTSEYYELRLFLTGQIVSGFKSIFQSYNLFIFVVGGQNKQIKIIIWEDFTNSLFLCILYHMKSKIINLFGGPGIGKSTQASGLFTEMKKHHMSVEYTYEFPKEVAWEGNVSQLSDQFFITANQHRNISRLYGKVDYIIVDSPIVLGCFYEQRYGDGYPASFYGMSGLSKFLWNLFRQYDNINILLTRNNETYDPNGRLQNLQEAQEIDGDIKQTLLINSIPFVEFPVGTNTAVDIFKYITQL